MNIAKEFLYEQLSGKSFRGDDEKYLHLIALLANTFATVMHLFLLVFYMVEGVSFLIALNTISLLVYMNCFVLINKKKYKVFGIMLTLEVLIYSIVSGIWVGTGNLTILYLFVTLIMQLVVPYAKMTVRSIMIILLWLSGTFMLVFGMDHQPLINLGQKTELLKMFNFQLAFWGILLEVFISNTIKKFIDQFNVAQLQKFKTQANVDPLTGLFNRRYAGVFFERIQTKKADQSWCVALLDIDNFKQINDKYGHAAGDAVLVALSGIVVNSLRKTDFVFRWGGEEVLMLIKDVDIERAQRILEKMRASLEAAYIQTESAVIRLTATIGATFLDPENIEQSIEICDKKMYQGKSAGKNRVVI